MQQSQSLLLLLLLQLFMLLLLYLLLLLLSWLGSQSLCLDTLPLAVGWPWSADFAVIVLVFFCDTSH
jgi:hypothetical protein